MRLLPTVRVAFGLALCCVRAHGALAGSRHAVAWSVPPKRSRRTKHRPRTRRDRLTWVGLSEPHSADVHFEEPDVNRQRR